MQRKHEKRRKEIKNSVKIVDTKGRCSRDRPGCIAKEDIGSWLGRCPDLGPKAPQGSRKLWK